MTHFLGLGRVQVLTQISLYIFSKVTQLQTLQKVQKVQGPLTSSYGQVIRHKHLNTQQQQEQQQWQQHLSRVDSLSHFLSRGWN